MNNNYKSVNWMQGMSVSSSHFIATENFLLERIMKNASALQNKFAYGLLPLEEMHDDENQMHLFVDGKGDGSRLVLDFYKGITKGGCLIEVLPNNPVVLECSSEIETAEFGWDIVLTVLPFERRPCGEPNMMETPPRYPFVDPVYKLSIIERDKQFINEYGPFDVVVGMLRKKDGELKIENSYIAPALAMSSSDKLKKCMEVYTRLMSSMKNSLSTILERAYTASTNKSDCLENCILFCKEILRAMTSMQYKWNNCGLSLSPYEVCEIFGEMSNSILLSFSFMSRASKDELLKYFYEWNGVAPSTFEEVLDEVASNHFSQNRIDKPLTSIHNMLQLLEDLLISLSKLDYVGQHKESMVISVTSAKETTEPSTKSSWLL